MIKKFKELIQMQKKIKYTISMYKYSVLKIQFLLKLKMDETLTSIFYDNI